MTMSRIDFGRTDGTYRADERRTVVRAGGHGSPGTDTGDDGNAGWP